MKAWIVTDTTGDFGSRIIFAETRGKAQAYALNYIDDFDFCDWTDLRITRFKAWDDHYKGNPEVDWEENKLELIRDYNWYCLEYDSNHCKDCKAKLYCDNYKN